MGLGPVIHFNPKGSGVDIDIGSGFRLYARFRPRSGNFVKVLYKKIKPRQWNYVAASYDYRSGIATLWRDSRPSVQRRIGRFGLATKYPILIGQKPGYTLHFQGKITCLQVYNFAMTSLQIRSKKKWCFREGTHVNRIYTSIYTYRTRELECSTSIRRFYSQIDLSLSLCRILNSQLKTNSFLSVRAGHPYRNLWKAVKESWWVSHASCGGLLAVAKMINVFKYFPHESYQHVWWENQTIKVSESLNGIHSGILKSMGSWRFQFPSFLFFGFLFSSKRISVLKFTRSFSCTISFQCHLFLYLLCSLKFP